MDETKQPGIKIAQVLLWSVLFEHRKDALGLPPTTNIEATINLEITATVSDDETQGLLVLKVSNDEGQKDALYRLSFEMVCIVERDAAAPNMTIREYLEKNGAATMYPFLREAVANVTARGRFGPLWLKPFNFAALGPGNWTQAPMTAESAPKNE